MHDQENDRPKRRIIDVIGIDNEIDYGKEILRLSEILRQVLYEFRAGRGAATQPRVATMARLEKDGSEYTVISQRGGHIRITKNDESYVFEANYPPKDAPPTLREYAISAHGFTEITPGEDEAGCQSIATAAQLIIWATLYRENEE